MAMNAAKLTTVCHMKTFMNELHNVDHSRDKFEYEHIFCKLEIMFSWPALFFCSCFMKTIGLKHVTCAKSV